jgi:N-acetylglutamate synthase-like GNAT family acetyltransferase
MVISLSIDAVEMRDAVSIRWAHPSEREALEALQWRASLNNPNDREALLAHPDAIFLPAEQIAAGQVYVAEQAQEIVAFAVLLPRGERAMQLDGLFVEPHFWRQGAGRLLVDYCCRVARKKGAALLHVLGNPHAEAFYRACGFSAAGKEKTRFGTGLLMRKEL